MTLGELRKLIEPEMRLFIVDKSCHFIALERNLDFDTLNYDSFNVLSQCEGFYKMSLSEKRHTCINIQLDMEKEIK